MIGAGTCTVDANQAGNADWNPAPQVARSFVVGKGDTVTVVTCAPGPFTYTGAPQTPCTAVVTGPGGLNQPVTVDYLANTDAGTATANADYPGDANYNASTDTATFAIGKADVTCTVIGYVGTYDGAPHGAIGTCTGVVGEDLSADLDLGASFTDAPGGTATWTFTDTTGNYNDDSGTVGIVVGKADTVTVVTCAPGPFTYTGAPQTPCTAVVTGPGLNQPLTVDYLANTDAGTATASADYPGDASYNASSDAVTFDIGKADASCTVIGYTGTYDGAPHGATGTCTGVVGEDLSADLDLGASFTDVPGGTADWTFTDTTGNYNDDSGTAGIDISRADPDCSVVGVSVTYDGSAHRASGTCTGVLDEVLAGLDRGASYTDVPGGIADWAFTDVTGNYNDASGSADIDIAKADPGCAIMGFSGTYDGSAHGATGDCAGVDDEVLAGLDRGASYTDVPGGTAEWTYTDETGNYTDDSGSVDITIAKAAQAIVFPPLPDVTISDHTVALGAVEGVVYTSLTPDVCTVSGTTVTLLAPGTCTIEATMAGDANHDAATPVIQTFAVTALPDTGTVGSNPMVLLIGLLTLMALGSLLVLGVWRRRGSTERDPLA